MPVNPDPEVDERSEPHEEITEARTKTKNEEIIRNNNGASGVPGQQSGNPLLSYLSDNYRLIFGKQWPPWLGGLILGLLSFALFAYYERAWFIYDGFYVTGDWLISSVGIDPANDTVNPWDSLGWVQNLGIILGAFISCLLANDFRIRFPTRRIRLVEGFTGGIIMGIGAMLAPGCNIGGYFSAIASLSASGFVMAFALGSGAYTGVLIARWRLKREVAAGMIKATIRTNSPACVTCRKPLPRYFQPLIGMGIAIVVLILYGLYHSDGKYVLGGYLLFGVLFGVVLQRAGFCVTASFRELFTTGGGGLARGVIVATIVAMLGFSILVAQGIRDAYVLPLGWRTYAGGYIFGLGMVIAGGCATGTLFRIGEGNVQLMLAFLGAAVSASLMLIFMDGIDFDTGPHGGEYIWLVDKMGWPGAILFAFIFLFLFYLVVQWNEMKRKVFR